MSFIFKSALATAMAFSLAGTAQASQVTFDLSGPFAVTSGSLDYTDAASGLELTTSAYRWSFDSTVGGVTLDQQVELNRAGDGLGVFSSNADGFPIDSFGTYEEAVRLEFSKPVRIISATFNYWDDVLDDFSIARYAPDGSFVSDEFFQDATCLTGTCSGVLGDLAQSGDYSFLGFSEDFAIGAEGIDDAYTLLSVTVAPIPVPPAIAMMLAGLGGFAVLRRRQSATSAA